MKILEYIAVLRLEAKQRALTEEEQSVVDIWNKNIKLQVENEKYKNALVEIIQESDLQYPTSAPEVIAKQALTD